MKGNIGHTNSAAGIASFAKTVLAIHHRTLPMSLGSDAVAQELRLSDSPFELLGKTRDWDTAPLAGVSSFGIGGTNAHVVLGPAPGKPPRPNVFERPVLLISSGATTDGARATADAIADFAQERRRSIWHTRSQRVARPCHIGRLRCSTRLLRTRVRHSRSPSRRAHGLPR